MKRPQRTSATEAQKRLKKLAATGTVRCRKPIVSESSASLHSETSTSCSESDSTSLLPEAPPNSPPEQSLGSLSSDESSESNGLAEFVVYGDLDESSVSWGERDEARIMAKRDLRALRLNEQTHDHEQSGSEIDANCYAGYIYEQNMRDFLRGDNYTALYRRFHSEFISPMKQFGSINNGMSPVNMLMAVHGAWILQKLPEGQVQMKRCTLCNTTKPTTYRIITQNGKLHVGYAGSSCYRRFVFIERAQDLLRVLVDAVQPGCEPDEEQIRIYCKQFNELVEEKFDCANFLEQSLIRQF